MKGIHHIVVFCTDTGASKAWYQKAGFKYLRGYQEMHWLDAGGFEVMLHPSKIKPNGALPNIHISVGDVNEHFEKVRKAGLEPVDHQSPNRAKLEQPVTRPWGDTEFELIDPDGNVWVFTQA